MQRDEELNKLARGFYYAVRSHPKFTELTEAAWPRFERILRRGGVDKTDEMRSDVELRLLSALLRIAATSKPPDSLMAIATKLLRQVAGNNLPAIKKQVWERIVILLAAEGKFARWGDNNRYAGLSHMKNLPLNTNVPFSDEHRRQIQSDFAIYMIRNAHKPLASHVDHLLDLVWTHYSDPVLVHDIAQLAIDILVPIEVSIDLPATDTGHSMVEDIPAPEPSPERGVIRAMSLVDRLQALRSCLDGQTSTRKLAFLLRHTDEAMLKSYCAPETPEEYLTPLIEQDFHLTKNKATELALRYASKVPLDESEHEIELAIRMFIDVGRLQTERSHAIKRIIICLLFSDPLKIRPCLQKQTSQAQLSVLLYNLNKTKLKLYCAPQEPGQLLASLLQEIGIPQNEATTLAEKYAEHVSPVNQAELAEKLKISLTELQDIRAATLIRLLRYLDSQREWEELKS